jgi:hypothetical protein
VIQLLEISWILAEKNTHHLKSLLIIYLHEIESADSRGAEDLDNLQILITLRVGKQAEKLMLRISDYSVDAIIG